MSLTPHQSRTIYRAAATVLLLAFIGIWAIKSRHGATLKIVFLDVGQGDCAVIESPSGKVMLIDTGGIEHNVGNQNSTLAEQEGNHGNEGDDVSDRNEADRRNDEGRRTVEPYLHSEGINHIDTIVLTHPHADHIGGAPTLIDDFPIDRLIDNGAVDDTQEVRKLLTEIHLKGVRRVAARPGETLDFQDGVVATIIAPTAAEVDGPINDASVVVRLTYGRTSFLFTGDAESGEEETMVANGKTLGCDVLKVGHHGSHTSSTPQFLAAAHPKIAVISVGNHNRYGHPSPEIVSRLASLGVRTFRTDRNGAVTCISDSVDVTCIAKIPGR